ncbi:MAG: bifunctional phosphopantothenoylcysteine decarboxylase/phosphopantothenate--cysteine ligase CoaBC [Bacteroidales bacterium]|nr:bifunctional phosphopantothenoylcysteine decarboxylase/phosphopantothenate--cysteine ligase CoaBC [Bacteroidales bacterium]
MPNQPLHIVLGISGGIAAYKSLSLIRLFQKNNAEVKVVVTPNALHFVTPLSLQTLSQNKVYTDPFQILENVDVEHIALAEWADALVVAPATANIIGKFAHGIADDALSTLFLACSKPVFLAPAMNTKMLHHPAVQQNIHTLRQRGCLILESGAGYLACGTTGDGRMQEPEQLCDAVMQALTRPALFTGKKVLITAGPTYEPIDPVRFIGNFSSGLMGFRLAETFASLGADVTLVTGPTHLTTALPNIHRINVQTAAQMLEACQKEFPSAHIAVMAAAVADYTPTNVAPEKIKKSAKTLQISLQKTTDILATLCKQKTKNQCVVGFALETEHELENAKAKLKNKKADIIVLNSLRNEGAGFQHATNLVTLIDKNGNVQTGELKDKSEVAEDIVRYIADYLKITK